MLRARIVSERLARMIRHIIITGGSGYIGTCVVKAALARAYRVTILSRSTSGLPPGARHIPWTLGDKLPDASLNPDLPASAQAIIHLAHDWRNPGMTAADEGGLNRAGTRALLVSSRQLGIGRFLFVSSQSAREDAENIYGRVKYAIEQELDHPGEIAARVGLVYGGPPAALFALMCKLTGDLPLLPMIDPWREVQPVHVAEVADGLLRMVDHDATGWMGLAAPVGVSFRLFLQTLAREFHGKSLPIFPIPLRLALLGCAVTARIPFLPTVDRERVLGLAGVRALPCADHLAALGMEIMPLAVGLRGEPGSRRAILAEGRALLAYILRAPPGNMLLRRYAVSIAAAHGGALPMSGLFRRVPALLRLAEPLSARGQLAQRLRLAATLVETSPRGEAMLAAGSLLGLGVGFLLDALALPFRLLRRG
jgi:nucleoside-diphosphate-sugar epimerase